VKISTAEFVLSAVKAPQLLTDDLPQIAFVGRSNVGKSSLLNRILSRKALARTSGTPGRTQAVNYFLINGSLHFVDLPGYGYAKASKSARAQWAGLMDSYFRQASMAPVLLVHLIDGKVGATGLDCEAHEYLSDLGHEMLKVATKIDKVKRGQRVRNLNGIRQAFDLPESVEIVPFSAVSGEGVKQLWRGIDTFLGQRREERAETGP
jgi:GTP-binding protein